MANSWLHNMDSLTEINLEAELSKAIAAPSRIDERGSDAKYFKPAFLIQVNFYRSMTNLLITSTELA